MWPFKKKKIKRFKRTSLAAKELMKYWDSMYETLLYLHLDTLQTEIEYLRKASLEYELKAFTDRSKENRKIYTRAFEDTERKLKTCYIALGRVMKRPDWDEINFRHVPFHAEHQSDMRAMYRHFRRENEKRLREKINEKS